MTRILIDCTLIRLRRIPTGIPRVVANYVKWGIPWGQAHGVEIALVVPHKRGLVLADWLLDPWQPRMRSGHSGIFGRIIVIAKIAAELSVKRLQLVVFYGIMAFGLLLPVPHRIVAYGANKTSLLMRRGLGLVPKMLDHLMYRVLDLPVQSGDILFCPAYWHDVPPAAYESLAKRGCRIFFLVHDILPVTHPQYYAAPWRDEFKANLIASFSWVEMYFCVSGYTRDELVGFAALTAGGPIRTAVMHNGYDLSTGRSGEHGSTKLARVCQSFPTFLIMVGSIEPKKQHVYVIDELSKLWDGGYDLPLLIIGRRGWMDTEIVDRVQSHPLLNKKLFWFRDVTDGDLLQAYRQARFLLFAAESEGFGLPLIEALCNGLPVVAYDTPIAREIAGDLCLYFDRDQIHLGDVLLSYADLEKYRTRKAMVSSFRWPSWEERADCLFDELYSVTANPRASAPSVLAVDVQMSD